MEGLDELMVKAVTWVYGEEVLRPTKIKVTGDFYEMVLNHIMITGHREWTLEKAFPNDQDEVYEIMCYECAFTPTDKFRFYFERELHTKNFYLRNIYFNQSWIDHPDENERVQAELERWQQLEEWEEIFDFVNEYWITGEEKEML